MTNKEIFWKAVEIAETKGFSDIYVTFDCRECGRELLDNNGYYPIIFSHDFAKAFWGEEWYTEQSPEQSNKAYYTDSFDTDNVMFQGMAYTYHLQQMILAKDPLKYIEKYGL